MQTAAPEYIRARRESDPLWLRRHRRSLGANRQHRRVQRARKELVKAQEKALCEARERKESVLAAKYTKAKGKPARLWDRAKRFFQSVGRKSQGSARVDG